MHGKTWYFCNVKIGHTEKHLHRVLFSYPKTRG
uniref:Uncharacterized protein n=1 Tax=Caudovirales sp. ctvQY7 TaxID=2825774 RepID=A0A8S5UFX5_9CAUD|nr:MAG TPA: hypothetical protein [Caudovirales sp. ctvQY7]